MLKILTVEKNVERREKFYKTKEYYYSGSQLLQVKEMLAGFSYIDDRSVNTTFYYQDLGGSTSVATNLSEDRYGLSRQLNYVAYFNYDVYGRLLYGDPAASHNICFSGKELDVKTGALYFGFRHYLPDLKRWNAVDPIRDGTNWYLYCAADPVNYIDPWGLDTFQFGVGTNTGASCPCGRPSIPFHG